MQKPYSARWKALLRACGGISTDMNADAALYDSSPRMRRYFPQADRRAVVGPLFSAHAEVFPKASSTGTPPIPLLRACGGISVDPFPGEPRCGSSPRMRRYFRIPLL